jgi:hypothetical protein
VAVAVLNCSSRRRNKHFVFILVAAVLMPFPAFASAISCEGRPTKEDFRILADHVTEVIVERRYWYDYGAVPQDSSKMVFGISPNPTETFDGANVIAIVPEINEAFLWSVCRNEFALKESLGADKNSLEKLEKGEYKSFFDPTSGARHVEMLLHFEQSPEFGPLDKWKTEMLGKIQNNIACFFAQNGTNSSEQKSLSLDIGDFNRQSTGVLIAIPELNDLWTLNFKLDSAGVPDGIGHSHEQKLSETKETLRSRLFEHSFVRNVELRCPAQ